MRSESLKTAPKPTAMRPEDRDELLERIQAHRLKLQAELEHLKAYQALTEELQRSEARLTGMEGERP